MIEIYMKLNVFARPDSREFKGKGGCVYTVAAVDRDYNPGTMSVASTSVPRIPSTLPQSSIVLLMVAVSGISYFDRTIISIAGPGIMKEFSLSETAMGTVYSAFILSYTIFMMPGGWLADRFGARMVVTVAGLGTALLTGLTALGGRARTRRADRHCSVVYSHPVSDGRIHGALLSGLRRAVGQLDTHDGAGLGTSAGNGRRGDRRRYLAPALFADDGGTAYGWRASFWLAAAPTAALFLYWFWRVRDRRPGSAPPRQSGTPEGIGECCFGTET